MKISSWQRWYSSRRNAKRTGRASHARSRRQSLYLELLEDRRMLSVTPQIVLDINSTTRASNPSEIVAVGSSTYFTADDGVHGRELWKSDGTDAGTSLVKDIYPGSAGSFYQSSYDQKDWLTNVNGTLFFTADDGANGWELWKSDGTAAGTMLVKDIHPGSAGSFPSNLVDVNGTLFFSANDNTHGTELWKSDGSAAGTVLVKDSNPGWNGAYPSSLANVNGRLFFSAYDGTHGTELWKSDGSTIGTVLVKDIKPGTDGSYPGNLTDVDGKLFLAADDGTHGIELWNSDGTSAGTMLAKDIDARTNWYGGPMGSSPSNLTDVNGTLFFTAFSDTGQELWKSNGTASGTTLVKDISLNGGSYPGNLTEVNGTLYFAASDDTAFRELWKSDGTTAGTVLVKDINPGSVGASNPESLINVGGIVYFTVWYTNVNGTPPFSDAAELWKSDGTESGTVLVKEFNVASPYDSHPRALTSANGTLMFAANDDPHGVELWKSDGTAAGTLVVKDINTSTLSSSPTHFTDVNGTLFFTADDGVHGYELWKSDGTVAGTALVKDLNPGVQTGYYGHSYPNSSSAGNFTNVDGTLFFTAYSVTTGHGLWKSDGTAAGTLLVSSLGWGIHNLTNVNGTLFFTAGESYYGEVGAELWKSDGTTAGTTLVKDIYPGTHREYGCGYYSCSYQIVPNSSSPSSLTNVDGTLFFTAYDGANGRELWKTDGSEAGTVLVEDIRPGTNGLYPHSSNPHALTNVNGILFFTANDGSSGAELWSSDGTDAGTVLVKDILPGASSEYPSSLTSVNGTLLFSAYEGSSGGELWKSDGTAAGTVLVKDIYAGSGDSTPRYPTNVNGTLFFSAADGTHGRELWKSDGTAAGTVLVQDVRPGSTSSYPGDLTHVNGTLFFTAHDDSDASTLWQSDGSHASAALVADLSASGLTNFGGTLFFSAYDGRLGSELWTLLDDGLPALTVGDATRTEGHAGWQSAAFTVTLSAASVQQVTVAYVTADGTATAGSDYQPASGTLTFAPGDTSKTISVLVYGDRLGEANENFFVNLSSATNAAIGDGQGAGTVLDDEPRVRISDVASKEGNSGTTAFAFTVSLSTAYDQPVTVAYATADGTATAGSDYQAASGTLSIPAGQTSGTISVLVNGDRLPEPSETLFVKLSSQAVAVIADDQGLATILNDEPQVSIGDVSIKEGRKNQTTLLIFTVTLSAAYDQAVTMSFQTTNGTAKTSDKDYLARSGTLTFNPGETTKTITIEVKGDSKREANETFYLDLYGLSSNALFAKNRGIATILNDD